VLFALDDTRPGDQKQLAAADLDFADLEWSFEFQVSSFQ
jgi:hypothetical protein